MFFRASPSSMFSHFCFSTAAIKSLVILVLSVFIIKPSSVFSSTVNNNKNYYLTAKIGEAEAADVENYSDKDYYQLASEYEDNLRASFAAAEEDENGNSSAKNAEQGKNKVSSEEGDDDNQNASSAKANTHQRKKKEESYAEMAYRLKCDNPWFWNAPKCTWIDVKARHVIKRTKRNAETSAWFLGSIIGFVMMWLCGLFCYYRLKLRNRRKMLQLREKYAPGRIVLPNGKVAYYTPNEEENKAYEELVKAIIIQEMCLI